MSNAKATPKCGTRICLSSIDASRNAGQLGHTPNRIEKWCQLGRPEQLVCGGIALAGRTKAFCRVPLFMHDCGSFRKRLRFAKRSDSSTTCQEQHLLPFTRLDVLYGTSALVNAQEGLVSGF